MFLFFDKWFSHILNGVQYITVKGNNNVPQFTQISFSFGIDTTLKLHIIEKEFQTACYSGYNMRLFLQHLV